MGNILTDKIKQIDTGGATSVVTGKRRVRLIQWICDAGDIDNDSDLVFVLGGITFTTKAKIQTDVGQQSVVLWELGPFNPGYKVDGYSVTTIDHGVLYVWED